MLYQVEAITSTVVVSSSSTTPHVPPDTTAATLSVYRVRTMEVVMFQLMEKAHYSGGTYPDLSESSSAAACPVNLDRP